MAKLLSNALTASIFKALTANSSVCSSSSSDKVFSCSYKNLRHLCILPRAKGLKASLLPLEHLQVPQLLDLPPLVPHY